MTEQERPLGEILGELHEALESAGDLDGEVRAGLQSAVAEIRTALDESSEASLPASLRERFAEVVEHFEETHPRLTGIIGRVADALADLGI